MSIQLPYSRGERAARVVRTLLAICAYLLITACGSSQKAAPQVAVDIHQGDVCAVCGMYIEAGPGPRAEAYVQGHKAPLKFGSTRDFFAYVLQPENKTRLQQLLVQDSARINWQHPSNAAQTFIDARSAWYVAWQPLPGEMGATFAPFASRQEATAFVRTHGGELIQFSDVTPAMTSLLGDACPAKRSPAFAFAKACAVPPHGTGLESAAGDERLGLPGHSQAIPHSIDPVKPSDSIPLPDGKVNGH